jgi:hypothetical protein
MFKLSLANFLGVLKYQFSKTSFRNLLVYK